MKGKRGYRTALEQYNEALQWSSKGSKSAENQKMYADILTNRAQVHMKMKNFGSCRKDVKASLKFDQTNVKTYYRGELLCGPFAIFKQPVLGLLLQSHTSLTASTTTHSLQPNLHSL